MTTKVRSIRRAGWLYSVLSILVMTAQLAVALAPLGESRDRRMASHIESGGAQTHRAHDDATCAACQARSIQGSTSRTPVPLFEGASPAVAFTAAAERVVSTESHALANPRAPPSVI